MSDLPALEATTDAPLDITCDALVVPVFRGGIEGPGAETALQALGVEEIPRDAGFRGKIGELQHLAAPGLACGRLTLVGLGRMSELTEEQVRRAAGAAVRALADSCGTIATTLPLTDASPAFLRAVAEGALLGAYRYDAQRSQAPDRRLRAMRLVTTSTGAGDADAVLARAASHARAQCVARDLVAMPPNELGPVEFADFVTEALADTAVEVEVWDQQRLTDERCGGHLGVARGSAREPRLAILRHRPADPVASVALVGKGITFDTGGISLKSPSPLMEAMKGDCAGAAAIAGAMLAIAETDLPVEVTAYLCLAENMPGSDAQRPSDVITIRNGRTVEVMNTDAEGRLVLADGLSLAAESAPDAIVDLATLTGSAFRAVGKRATAAFGNDDDLLRQVLAAAEDAGETTWHMPLWDELVDNLDSETGDIENLGRGDEAGATMAGLFLREFVDETPWVHLDIAGPAWQDADRYHSPKHGTGAGVRTLLRWLEAASGQS